MQLHCSRVFLLTLQVVVAEKTKHQTTPPSCPSTPKTKNMYYKWIVSIFVVIALLGRLPYARTVSKNYKISPKPCSAQGYEGTCMFVWECIKSEGQHLGVCIDTFMFGSCCAHNLTENIVLPQTISYVPSKPISVTKKPAYSSKPVVSSR